MARKPKTSGTGSGTRTGNSDSRIVGKMGNSIYTADRVSDGEWRLDTDEEIDFDEDFAAPHRPTGRAGMMDGLLELLATLQDLENNVHTVGDDGDDPADAPDTGTASSSHTRPTGAEPARTETEKADVRPLSSTQAAAEEAAPARTESQPAAGQTTRKKGAAKKSDGTAKAPASDKPAPEEAAPEKAASEKTVSDKPASGRAGKKAARTAGDAPEVSKATAAAPAASAASGKTTGSRTAPRAEKAVETTAKETGSMAETPQTSTSTPAPAEEKKEACAAPVDAQGVPAFPPLDEPLKVNTAPPAWDYGDTLPPRPFDPNNPTGEGLRALWALSGVKLYNLAWNMDVGQNTIRNWLSAVGPVRMWPKSLKKVVKFQNDLYRKLEKKAAK